MKSATIKKINENLPDSMKRLFSTSIRNKLIKNTVFQDQYNELLAFEALPASEKTKLQQKKMEEQLRYAYEQIPIYREQFDKAGYDVYKTFNAEVFSEMPILSKATIKKNFRQYLSPEEIDYYTAQTGGTSGEPLKLYLDKESIFREKAFIYYQWSKLGYNYQSSKLVTFRGVDVKNRFYKRNPLYNEMIVSPFYLNVENIHRYIKLINRYQPDYFHGYPSAINNFCRIIREENIQFDIQLKGVFFISEEVNEQHRNFVEETLNCETMAFYGHSERAVFGEEIRKWYYRFHELYGYTELVPSATENEYKIIATGFLNRKMPLVRYDTEDTAVFDAGGMRIRGCSYRQNLVGINGEVVSIRSKVFHEGMFNRFTKYQFVQNEPGKVEIIVLDRDKEKEKEKLNAFLQDRFGGVIDFTIRQQDQLILTQRGKEKILIQNIENM